VLLGRQKAIEWLTREEMRSHIVKWAELLRKVPDLERLFQRFFLKIIVLYNLLNANI
jgi:DNA mismatch repair ATPase MutS